MHVACPGNGLQVRHSLCQVPPEAGTASEVLQMGRGEKEPVWRQKLVVPFGNSSLPSVERESRGTEPKLLEGIA